MMQPKNGMHHFKPAALTIVIILTMTSSTAGDETDQPYPAVGEPSGRVTLYDEDSQHPWNRLHETLFVRQLPNGKYAGHDEIDPLLWYSTTHLLHGESHAAAIRVLDEFLAGDPAIRDPLKRAVLQNDLWYLFDWLVENRTNYRSQRHSLARRVARAMKMIALSKEELAGLPDNRHPALDTTGLVSAFDPDSPDTHFFPADLLEENGPWVCISRRSGQNNLSARLHVEHEGARSTFAVFMRLPGGRAETVNYLDTLNLYERPIELIDNPVSRVTLSDGYSYLRRGDVMRINPDTPQFPDGTQFAFLRMMGLIDDEGQITRTKIIRQLQTRVYLDSDRHMLPIPDETPTMVFGELRMKRALLLSTGFGLSPVGPDEPVFGHFFSRDEQQFTRGPSVLSCVACHSRAGIESVNTYDFRNLSRGDLAPTLKPTTLELEAALIIDKKRERYDWGVLETLWSN